MNPIHFYEFGKKRIALNNGLVAYYSFDNTLNDSINGNNATNTGTTFIAGKINQSLTFTFNQRLSIPQTTNLDFSNVTSDIPFSMSFWVFKTDTALVELFNKRGVTGATDQWSVTQTNGIIEVRLYSNSTTAFIGKRYSSSQFASNIFAHCVITYDGSGLSSGIKIYHNGALATLTDTSVGSYTKMPIASQVARVNSLNGANSGYGRVDELAVWKNRVLSAVEATYLYNSGTGKAYPF